MTHGVSVADWTCADAIQYEKRQLDEEAEALSHRLDDVGFDQSWENVSRLIVPLAIRMKAVAMLRGSSYTGPLISSCDDHIQAYTRCSQPYVNFWYFGERKKRVKVTM